LNKKCRSEVLRFVSLLKEKCKVKYDNDIRVYLV